MYGQDGTVLLARISPSVLHENERSLLIDLNIILWILTLDLRLGSFKRRGGPLNLILANYLVLADHSLWTRRHYLISTNQRKTVISGHSFTWAM